MFAVGATFARRPFCRDSDARVCLVCLEERRGRGRARRLFSSQERTVASVSSRAQVAPRADERLVPRRDVGVSLRLGVLGTLDSEGLGRIWRDVIDATFLKPLGVVGTWVEIKILRTLLTV